MPAEPLGFDDGHFGLGSTEGGVKNWMNKNMEGVGPWVPPPKKTFQGLLGRLVAHFLPRDQEVPSCTSKHGVFKLVIRPTQQTFLGISQIWVTRNPYTNCLILKCLIFGWRVAAQIPMISPLSEIGG